MTPITYYVAALSDSVIIAIIGAVPLTVGSIAAVIGAINSRRVVKQTKTNGGSTMKDDLVAIHSSVQTLQGTTGILSDLVMAHVTDAQQHQARTATNVELTAEAVATALEAKAATTAADLLSTAAAAREE